MSDASQTAMPETSGDALAGASTVRLARYLRWLLLGLVVLLYGHSTSYGWVYWDDFSNIAGQPALHGFSWANLRAICTPGGTPPELLFIPVSYVAWLVQVNLPGGDLPLVLHAVNALLHLANVLLVHELLRALLHGYGSDDAIGRREVSATREWLAFFAAACFAVHPLQVETVAWMIGQRDLLAAFFALLALHAWRRGIADDGAWRARAGRGWRGVAVVLYLLGCLAKPSVVLLPGVFVLLHICRGERRVSRLVAAVVPSLVGLVAVLWLNGRAAATAGAASSEVGGLVWQARLLRLAAVPEIVDGWLARLLLLQTPHAFYLNSELYDAAPRAAVAAPGQWLTVLPPLLLVGGAWIAWRSRQRLASGAAFFAALMLAPAGQLVLDYNRYFYTADRFIYLAMPGIALAVGALCLAALPLRWRVRGMATLALAVVAVSFVRAWPLLSTWEGPKPFWQHQLQANPHNPIALNNFATWLLGNGERDAARDAWREAVRQDPGYAVAWYNLGVLADQEQATDLATRCFRRAELAQPGATDALVAIAMRHLQRGDDGAALDAFNTLLARRPRYAAALIQRGTLYQRHGDGESARQDFEAAVAAAPGLAMAHFKLGVLLHGAGERERGIAEMRLALRCDPGYAKAAFNLGVMLAMDGDANGAIDVFERASQLDTESPDALRELGNLLLAVQRPVDAAAAWERALSRQPADAALRDKLAALLLDTLNRPADAARIRAAAPPDSVAPTP